MGPPLPSPAQPSPLAPSSPAQPWSSPAQPSPRNGVGTPQPCQGTIAPQQHPAALPGQRHHAGLAAALALQHPLRGGMAQRTDPGPDSGPGPSLAPHWHSAVPSSGCSHGRCVPSRYPKGLPPAPPPHLGHLGAPAAPVQQLGSWLDTGAAAAAAAAAPCHTGSCPVARVGRGRGGGLHPPSHACSPIVVRPCAWPWGVQCPGGHSWLVRPLSRCVAKHGEGELGRVDGAPCPHSPPPRVPRLLLNRAIRAPAPPSPPRPRRVPHVVVRQAALQHVVRHA